MPDRTFLDWPFFEERHRELAAALEEWCTANLPVDHSDVDGACKALVRDLGAAGFLQFSGGEDIDVRSLCLIRETLARHDGLADFAFAMQGLGMGSVSLFGSDEQREWLKKTRAGLIIQAALTHPHMVGHLGHNVPLIFMTVFGIGCALAGLAGVIAGNIFVTDPAMAVLMGPIVFVVVVVGGIGSLEGAFLASILIGLLQNFAVGISASFADIFWFTGLSPTSEIGDITVSSLAPVLPFLLLVLMLIFRPRGLMGEQEL